MNGESKTRRRSHLTLVPPSKEQEWVFGLPAGPRPSPRSVHRLKISLRGARPPIWRRVEVPSTIRFSELHRVIQEAMGWLDLSAHHFVHDDHVIGVPDDEALETVHDERRIKLWAVTPEPGDRLEYEYDFRAFWAHTIVVEAVSLEQAPLTTPRCITGRCSSPPESLRGGMYSFRALLKQLAHPAEREAAAAQLPPDFDPAHFDKHTINDALAAIELEHADP